jgi:phospholipase/carboxylesterase
MVLVPTHPEVRSQAMATDDPEAGPPPGRLAFRPRPATGTASGVDEPLGLGDRRDGVLYVPDTAERGAPVMVFLHGAGGTGRRELRAVVAAADRYGTVIAAPDSRGPTWDLIEGGFGPDVTFIDRVLDVVADRCAVDFDRLAVGGISDGASYALSLGMTNGDLFGGIVAFSPGFALPGPLVGRPRVYISHGTADPVLPIDACSRQLVPALVVAGYDVTYDEFDGGHTVPPVVADKAFAWWAGAVPR